jgi:hypothetical protein
VHCAVVTLRVELRLARLARSVVTPRGATVAPVIERATRAVAVEGTTGTVILETTTGTVAAEPTRAVVVETPRTVLPERTRLPVVETASRTVAVEPTARTVVLGAALRTVVLEATARSILTETTRAVAVEPTAFAALGTAGRTLRSVSRTVGAITAISAVVRTIAPIGAAELAVVGALPGASALARAALAVATRDTARTLRGDAARRAVVGRPSALLGGIRLGLRAVAAVSGAATAGLARLRAERLVAARLLGAVARIEVRTSGRLLVLGHEGSSGLFSSVHGRTRDTSSRPCRNC